MLLKKYLDKIPEGYSKMRYEGNKYGVIKQLFNQGKSCKIYAKQLGGNNFISLNFYNTKNREILKPCEMPHEKVVNFLENCETV